jgi:hypothetical protein
MIIAEGIYVLPAFHIPIGISLGIVALLISGSMIASLIWPPPVDPHQEVLDNTEAASLVADVPSMSSMSMTAASEDSGLSQLPTVPPDSKG